MTAAEIVERAKDLVQEELGVEREKIVPEAVFLRDFDCDSLDMVETLMCFEKEFDIDISDEDAEGAFKSFGALTAYLPKRLDNDG